MTCSSDEFVQTACTHVYVYYVLLLCCHRDEAKGNPLVAGDEDIESEEEVSAVVLAPSSDLTHKQCEGKPPLNRSAKLKTVKDVQLTESESDTDQPVTDSVEENHQPTKIKMSGEFTFRKGRKVAHSEEGQPPASATLDLDSWLEDAGQGEAESKVRATIPLTAEWCGDSPATSFH